MNFEKFWREVLVALICTRWAKCEPIIQKLHEELMSSLTLVKIKGPTAEILAKLQKIGGRMQEVCHQHDLGLLIGMNWNPPEARYIHFPIDPARKADAMLADLDPRTAIPQ